MLLRKILGITKPATEAPYKLSPEQLTRLKVLTSYPEWQDFTEILDTLCILHGEELLCSNDAAQMQFLRGFVLGLRKAGTFIDETLRTVEAADARKRQSESDSERKRRSADFFGTGFFRRA